MQFFCFHRDREASREMRMQLVERHWSYMDGYETALLLRGPTYDDDDVLTGSVHIVEMASRADAWAFALDEPGYQAGVYRDVMVRRWRDGLGRTMWDYPDRSDPEGLFLVLGFEPEPTAPPRMDPPDADLVAYGQLLSDDATQVVGWAAVVRAASEETAVEVLPDRHLVGVEVRRWTFGGRR